MTKPNWKSWGIGVSSSRFEFFRICLHGNSTYQWITRSGVVNDRRIDIRRARRSSATSRRSVVQQGERADTRDNTRARTRATPSPPGSIPEPGETTLRSIGERSHVSALHFRGRAAIKRAQGEILFILRHDIRTRLNLISADCERRNAVKSVRALARPSNLTWRPHYVQLTARTEMNPRCAHHTRY